VENITLEMIALVFAFRTLLGSQIGGLVLMLSRMNEQDKRMDGQNNRIDNLNTT